MFWKRRSKKTSEPASQDRPKKARLDVESLEKRVLLSASWVDAETGEAQDGATNAGDAFSGSEAADLAAGMGGDDILSGNGGDDVLAGGAGNDTLDGGSGIDTADYSEASGPVTVDITLDGVAQDTSGDGVDTLTSIEAVKGSQHDDTFVFSQPADGASYTIDGNGGTNTIELGQVDSADAVVGSGRIVVQTDGAMFEIDYSNVESVTFADGPVETPEPDAIDQHEPMHRWHFTDAGAVDLAGDSSGTLEGDTAASSDGSATFDGSDHVVLEHTDDMLLDEGTVHLRFNADDINDRQGLLSKDSTGYDDGGHLTIWVDDGEIEVRLQSASQSITLTSDVGLEAGEWHDVAVSFGEDGAKLFVNGELAASDSYTGGLGSSSGGTGNTEPIVVGANAWQSGDGQTNNLKEHFTGQIADVAIFGEQLEAKAIAEMSPEPPMPTAADIGLPDTATTEAEMAARGPVAHWSFSESGVTDKVGSADGTYSGSAEVADADGRAVSFDGSGDYVVIDHDAALELNEGSIELRFNTDDANARQGLFSKDSSGYDDGGHVTMWVDDGRVEVRVQSDDSSYTLRSDAVVTSGQWTDVALHFGEDGLQLYVNGELEDSDAYTGGLGTSSGGTGNTEPIVIGANQWGSGDGVADNIQHYFSGQIADVAIYGPEPEVNPDDVFDLTGSVAGDAHTIDGGDGNDTIDLSTFSTDSVSFADGQLTVATDDGGSFTVEYEGIESISFADGTATIVDSDMADVAVSNGDILIDGDVAVQIGSGGDGVVTVSHSSGESGFEVESSAETLVLESLGESAATFDITNTNADAAISVDGDAGTVDLGTGAFTGSLVVSGSVQSLSVGGDFQADATIEVGSAGSVTFGDDVLGSFTATGDVGTLTVTDDVYNGGSIALGGGVGTLAIGDLVRTGGTVTVGGFAETVSIGNDVQADASLSFGQAEVIEVGDDVAGTITVVSGTVDTIEIGGNVTSDATITLGGDFNDFSAGSFDSGTMVVVENAAGTTTFSESSGSHSVTLDEPTRITFDGDSITTPNEAPTDIWVEAEHMRENTAHEDILLAVMDPDGDTAFSFEVSDDRFEIHDDDGEYTLRLKGGVTLDHEAESSVSVTVTATDEGGESFQKTFDLAVVDVNESPAGLGFVGGSVAENAPAGTVVASASATDPDAGDSLTYALTDDAGGLFAIDAATGEIVTTGELDHEDASSHTVTVRAVDGDGLSIERDLTVTVGDVNESPTALAISGGTVAENAAAGTVAASVAVSDPDASETFSYALTDDAGGRFEVNDAGEIVVAQGASIDHESNGTHSVTVEVTDSAGNVVSETFEIAVGDVFEAPLLEIADATGSEDSPIPLSIQVGELQSDAVHEVTVSGLPEGAALSAGTDNGDGTWTLRPEQLNGLAVTPPLDFNGSFELGVEATASKPAGYILNDTFDSENNTKHRGNYSGFQNWTVEHGTVDLIGVTGWDFQPGSGMSLDMDGSTSNGGVLSLKDTPNLEPGRYELSFDIAGNQRRDTPEVLGVTAGDGLVDASFERNRDDDFRTVTVVVDITEPTEFDLTFAQEGGDNVGMLLDNIRLRAVGGDVDLGVTEHDTQLPEATGQSATTTGALTVEVAPVNDTPVGLGFVGGSVAENAPAGTAVASASATDPDAGDILTYSLADDAGGRFAIDAETGAITTKGPLDHESAGEHTVQVVATDADGLTVQADLTITVGDVNESPLGLGFVGGSVAENAPAGTVVASASATDPDAGDSLTYALADDAGGLFAIDAATGEIITTGELDHESASSHTLTVRAVDGDGLAIERDLTVTVGDVNEGPALARVEPIVVGESETVALSVNATDAEGDALTYTWTQTGGTPVVLDGADTASPTITTPDVGSDTTLTFEVAVSDGEHTTTEVVTVEVQANEAPVLDTDGAVTVREGEAVTLEVAARPAGTVSFEGVSIDSHGGSSQDIALDVAAEGDALRMEGNGWKSIDFPYEVTEDTVLEFQFRSSAEGELHGIGFDTDSGLSAENTFKLLGTQNWGNQSFVGDATDDGEWVTYRIPVGEHFTGDFDRLVFMNDHDVASPTAVSEFRGIRVYEAGDTTGMDSDLAYEWSQIGGPAVTLDDPTSTTPTFDAPDVGQDETITFKVTVSDGDNVTTETVEVTVVANPGPKVVAGDDIVVDERGEVTLSAVIEAPEPETLDFDAADIGSHGGSGQDIDLEVVASGDTLELTGNGWKSVPMDAEIRPDTVLEFQYRSDATGEIHGIGFDTDGALSQEHTFQLSGTQRWGIQAEHNYEGNEGEWVTYRIPVGEHFTGDFDRIVFVNDHDVPDAHANSAFRGLRLTNTADDGTPAIDSDISYNWEQISGPAVTLSDASAANPTFEAPEVGETSEIRFRVTASDGDNTTTDVVTVQVNPVNDAPAGLGFVGGSVSENAPAGTVVASASATDPDAGDSLTYALVDDAGGRFAIDAASGEIVTTGELDHEQSSSHTLTVRAVDGDGLSIERDLTVTVGDVNESPAGLGFVGGSVSENAPAGTVVASASATDPDAGDSLTYALADDANGLFAIDAATGEIVTTGELDHESASSHTVTVRAVDGDGLAIERDLTVTVGDVNESPAGLGFVGGSVSENAPAGTVVASASATDPDAGDSLTYALADDANGLFAIDAATGEIVTTGELDHESASSHTVTVRAVDGDGLAIERDLTVTVGDVNESPAGLGFVGGSVSENAPAGTVVASASATDPDAGDSLTYALVDDAGGRFAIDAASGEIVTTGELDHESASSHTVTVRAVDGDGLAIERDLTVTVGDVNESPTVSGVSAFEAVQGEPVTLGVDVVDPDAADDIRVTWRQTAGPVIELDGMDTSSPSFVAPNLEVATEFRFVAVVDDGEHSVEKEVVVTVASGDAGRDRMESDRAAADAAGEPLETGPLGEPAMASDAMPAGVLDDESSDGTADPVPAMDALGVDDVTPRPVSVPETIEWITGEIQELAEIAASIQPADLERVMPATDQAGESTFDDVFVEDGETEPAYEEGRATDVTASEASSDTFFGRFVALMRAGFGIHQRSDEDEAADRMRDKFKR